MKNKEFLLNLGFFYSVVIPEEKKCYILKGKDFEHSDVQNFINNEVMDYSQYESTGFPYDVDESWTSYLEAQNPVQYTSENDLSEAQFIDNLTARKSTDGLVLAIKDPAKDKVKVFKKNMQLFHG
jgi:hypothetical protein